jgi:branched-subunit amino acid ABC-type transport system permease component
MQYPQQIIFTEKQRFTQWWLWVILIGINLLFIYGLYLQVYLHEPIGGRPAPDGLLWTGWGISLFIIFLIRLIFLKTVIKGDGVYMQFFPFHFKLRYFPFNDLDKVFVKKYSPLMDYGGWGIRIGLFGKGTAYNISGNMGLQLIFNNSKKILIGTQQPLALREALESIGQFKDNAKP